MLTRIVAVLVAIAVGGTGFAVPAVAAPLGTVTIGQQSGAVTDTPMFATANTSGACPSGFGANALIRIGRPDGPFTNLARPMTAGGYDRVPVVAGPDRSFESALGRRPDDGTWLIVVECFSQDAGRFAERFATPVTVTGTAWRVGGPGPAAAGSDPVAGSDGMAVEILIGGAVVLAALAVGGVLLAGRRLRKAPPSPTTNRRSRAGSSSGRS